MELSGDLVAFLLCSIYSFVGAFVAVVVLGEVVVISPMGQLSRIINVVYVMLAALFVAVYFIDFFGPAVMGIQEYGSSIVASLCSYVAFSSITIGLAQALWGYLMSFYEEEKVGCMEKSAGEMIRMTARFEVVFGNKTENHHSLIKEEASIELQPGGVRCLRNDIVIEDKAEEGWIDIASSKEESTEKAKGE